MSAVTLSRKRPLEYRGALQFGRLFGLIDPDEFESAFRRWVSSTVVGPISVSIGLASATGAENSEDEVVRLADQRLYQAKANGRNRVEISA